MTDNSTPSAFGQQLQKDLMPNSRYAQYTSIIKRPVRNWTYMPSEDEWSEIVEKEEKEFQHEMTLLQQNWNQICDDMSIGQYEIEPNFVQWFTAITGNVTDVEKGFKRFESNFVLFQDQLLPVYRQGLKIWDRWGYRLITSPQVYKYDVRRSIYPDSEPETFLGKIAKWFSR